MEQTSSDLQAFLVTHKQLIEALLARLLPTQEAAHKLFAAMRYSVLNNGKRLRPAMVYAAGMALNTPIEKLHAAAASVELIHCYSLIHDDLPAMDDDDLRRGQPTCHKAFDEATAILAGDALQTMAFQILADAELNPVNPQQQVNMITALTRAAGAAGMILGQAEDMAAEGQLLSLDKLIKLHQHKTGALFTACMELCLIASGRDNDHTARESLLDYAKNIGLAFQIQDDILDVTGDDLILGKRTGSDQAANKSTFPELLGLEEAIQHANLNLSKATKAVEPLGDSAEMLKKLAYYILHRSL